MESNIHVSVPIPTEAPTVAVSVRTVEARIRGRMRRLPDPLFLRKVRCGSRNYWEDGPYYTYDNRRFLNEGGLSLDELVREYGVLRPWERVAED
jgi:hypothetical protein